MAGTEPLFYEVLPGRAPDAPLLVLLHGRGANENDLPPIVDYVARGWNAVSVRAPLAFAVGGYAWYTATPGGGPEAASLGAAARALAATLAEVRRRFAESTAVLLGFSQGALMALAGATARPEGVVAAVALSGYLPADELLPAPLAALRGFPVFQTHARNDYILPFALGQATRERLLKAGAEVTWVEHEGGHSIPLEAMERLATWLYDLPSR